MLKLSAGVSGRLAGIILKLSRGVELRPPLAGLEWMVRLASGELAYGSDLDLDTDGKEDPGISYERTHQAETSIDPGGRRVSSNSTPYFVLPGGFGAQFGIKLGDVAAVLFNDKIEFAVLADTGPRSKIGEGSIALHRSMGFERVVKGRIKDIGITSGVVTVVFPGSGDGTAQTPEKIRAIGAAKFVALGGILPPRA